MYTVYSDSTRLIDPSKSILLINPILEQALNKAGSFSFSIPTSHEACDSIRQSSRITVFKDGEAIFYGGIPVLKLTSARPKPSKQKVSFLIWQILYSVLQSIMISLFEDSSRR